MNINLVPVSQLMSVIPALIPYLEESAKWTRGRSIVEDIVRFLLNGQMYLWAVDDGQGQVLGHVIAEIKQYPQCKMMTVQYCAGEPNHMHAVEDDMFLILEQCAKHAGCSGIEFVGRPGWRATANKYGYELQSVMYQKFFEVTA